jgi:hypothetical protein
MSKAQKIEGVWFVLTLLLRLFGGKASKRYYL